MATSIDTETIRKRLEEDRTSLQEQIDALQIANDEGQADDYGSGHHYGDDATELFLRERNLAVSGDLRTELDDVERALERIEAGTYGKCAECGEPINPERLEARPAAIYCIRHQRERERNENDNG
jgi:RNA polymerase-binding transcription factor DksA